MVKYGKMLMFLIVFSDTITYIMWSVACGRSLEEMASVPKLMIISNLLNIIIFFLTCRIFTSLIEKNEISEIKKQESLFPILMTVFECYIVYSMVMDIFDNSNAILIIELLIGFLFLNVYVIYIIRKTAGLYKYKYDAELLTKLNEMQLEHYRELDGKYQDTRQIIHDMKKHLLVISELNGTGNEICFFFYVAVQIYAMAVMIVYTDFTYLGALIEQTGNIVRDCVFAYLIKAGVENIGKIWFTDKTSGAEDNSDEAVG